jgi:hypothetical protein
MPSAASITEAVVRYAESPVQRMVAAVAAMKIAVARLGRAP